MHDARLRAGRVPAVSGRALLLALALGACGDAPDVDFDATRGEDAIDVADGVLRLTACPPNGVPPEPYVCEVALSCSRGQECCCDGCYSSGSIACAAGGTFDFGYFSDACYLATCSEGCPFDHVATPAGCERCGPAQESVEAAVDEAAGDGACTNDDDCAVIMRPTIHRPLSCSARCAIAHAVADVGVPDAVLAVGAFCFDIARFCELSLPTCEAHVARCQQSRCVALEVCDPSIASEGDACDDNDRCTQDERCNARGQCRGAALDCDDGDPDTTDWCHSLDGCRHF